MSGCENDDPTLGTKLGIAVQIFFVAFNWWVLPIVTEIRHPSKIWKKIQWNCIVATTPGNAGFYATYNAGSHEDRIQLYFGSTHAEAPAGKEKPKASTLTIIFGLIGAIATIYPSIQLISDRSQCSIDNGNIVNLQQFWFYPTLPGAITGIFLIFDAKLFKLGRYWSTIVRTLLLVVIGVGLGVGTMSANGAKFTPQTAYPIAAFIVMSLPWPNVGWLGVASCSWLSRNGALAFGRGESAFLPDGLRQTWFIVLMFLQGAVCCGIACYGTFMKDGPVEERKALSHARSEGKREEEERRKAEEGLIGGSVNSFPLADNSTAYSAVPMKEPVAAVHEI